MESIRRQGRRLAWLMAGAAIGLAVVLLVVVAAAVAVGLGAGPAADGGAGSGTVRSLRGAGPVGMIAGASVLLAALLGLVPGVRELEVTGARGMLGAEGELLVPRRPRAGHHARTALWVVLHLGSGLLCAALLATFVPSAALFLVEIVTGGPLGSGLPLPESPVGRRGAAALALLIGAASALAWWPLGAGLVRLAPHLLGPTAADRLEAAEQRVAREAERTRIARELHDGIGHALTVVSVQAAAARTVQLRDPEAAAAALAAIEETARGATGELDAVLALLREEERGRQAPRRPAPHGAAAPNRAAGPHGPSAPTSAAATHGPSAPNGAVTPYRSAAPGRTASPSSAASPDRSDAGTDSAPADDLETLLASHRRAGMDLRRRGRLPADLAPLERRHLLRGLGEMLANAQRHAADGPVDLALSADGERVRVEVTSPLPVGPGEPEASAAPALPVGPDRPAYPARPTHADSPDHPDHVDRPDHVDHPDLAVASADLSASSGGRGLVGLRERAALLGGVLEAGPQGESWVARLDLPLLREEER